MSSEDQKGNDSLESLIASYLEADKSGLNLDRDGLIEEHPDLADSLRDFFANHDRMKAAANLDDPTLPPTGGGLDEPTIPPGRGTPEEGTVASRATGDDPPIPPTEPAWAEGPNVGDQVRYFGDNELLEEIARGGMGVVFKARQINLNRIVALKMILSGQFAGEEDVRRFYTEAEAAAQLDHPGIVPIFEIGEYQGQHYFSMGYIEGQSLAQKVADGPLPPREAAELVKKICDAMAYAHDRGVIHRDLKPANILIDQNGQPKVTDFGLAKRTEADSSLTGTGQILGTPAYMPPEQASGKTDVGPLADVYSLGAILYCLLTGRPPFQSASPMDTLLQVLDKEPIAVRQLNPSTPIDLETICLKCLNKSANRRYASSSELGDELNRFLSGNPIQARPAGPLERGWRWCKRNPALSATSAVTVLLLLTIAIASPIIPRQQSELRAEIQAQKERAESELRRAEQLVYMSQVSTAHQEYLSKNTPGAWQSLNATQRELRGWEYDYLYSMLRGDQPALETHEAVASLAFSPDGSLVATGGREGTVQLWDAASGVEVFTHTQEGMLRTPVQVFFSTNGKSLLGLNFHERLTIWDVTNGVVNSSIVLPQKEGDIVRCATLSSDGKLLAFGGGRLVSDFEDRGRHHRGLISVWNVSTGEPIHSYLGRSREVVDCIAFGLGDQQFVTGGQDGLVLWDLATGKERGEFETSSGVSHVVFSKDGQTLIGGRSRKWASIWKVDTLELLHSFPGSGGSVTALAVSADGKSVLTGYRGGDKLVVWDVATGDEKFALEYGGVSGIAISPDGTRIASGGKDRSVKIWDFETGAELFSGQGHTDRVTSVAFSADGQRLVSGGVDRSIKIWGVDKSQDYVALQGHRKPVGKLVFAPDGKLVASAGYDGFARVWNLMTGEQVGSDKYSMGCPVVSFSDGSDRIVSGTYGIFAWDPATSLLGRSTTTGDERELTLKLPEPYVGVDISPDGDLIVAMPYWTQPTAGRRIVVFNRKTSESLYAKQLSDRVFVTAFRPDGKRIALAYQNRVEILDVSSGEVALTVEDCRPPVAFSSDGNWIATGSGATGNGLQIIDAESGRRIATLNGHSSKITCIAFSPDGNRLVSGSADKTLKAWDVKSKLETITLRGHSNVVTSVLFHPEGNLIVSGDADGRIRLWNATHSLVQLGLPGDVWLGRWEVTHTRDGKASDLVLDISRNDQDYLVEIDNRYEVSIESISDKQIALSLRSRAARGSTQASAMSLHLSGTQSAEGNWQIPGQQALRSAGVRKSFGDGRSVSEQSVLGDFGAQLRIPLGLTQASTTRSPLNGPSDKKRRNPFDEIDQPQMEDQRPKQGIPADTPSTKERRNPFDGPDDLPNPQSETDSGGRTAKATFAESAAIVSDWWRKSSAIANMLQVKLAEYG